MATTASADRRSSPGPVLVGGLVVVALYVALLFIVMDRGTWDQWGGMLVLPVLVLISLPMFARQARREGDPRVFWILLGFLAVKMLASTFRYLHAFHISESGSDARQYDSQATEIALRFLDGDYTTGLSGLTESNWMRFFTALIYTALRPSVLAAFYVYAWLAFVGTYYFYRAFVLAVPDGDHRSYGRWLFLLPSLLFWPSSIGKEAWMMFGLGIAAFGAAKVFRERMIPGVLICAAGLGLAAIVRVPFAAAMGVGFVVAGVIRSRESRVGRRRLPFSRLASLVVFAGVSVVLISSMGEYLARSGLSGLSVDEIIVSSTDTTGQGGSEFDPSPVTNPLTAVVGTVTVLFRPFITEAGSPEAIGSALEGTVLALVVLFRWRSFVAAVAAMRRVPYMTFALLYTGGTIFMLSAVANFGILVRTRTLLFPTFLAMLCFLPSGRVRRQREREARSALPETAETREPVGAPA